MTQQRPKSVHFADYDEEIPSKKKAFKKNPTGHKGSSKRVGKEKTSKLGADPKPLKAGAGASVAHKVDTDLQLAQDEDFLDEPEFIPLSEMPRADA